VAGCGYARVQTVKRERLRGATRSFRSRCALPVQFDFGVVRGAENGDEHANAVQRRHRNSEKDNSQKYGQALLQVAADRDCQGASDLVCLERDDVERESHEAVAQDGEEEGVVKDAFGDCGLEAGELAAREGVEETLGCGERGHAEEHFHRGKGQRSSHQSVGGDGLDGGKYHTKESEEEADHGKVVIAKGRQCNTKDERDHRDVGVAGVGSAVDNAVNDNSRDRAGGSKDLVEGY